VQAGASSHGSAGIQTAGQDSGESPILPWSARPPRRSRSSDAVDRGVAELLLDTQQLVVLRDPITAARRPRFDPPSTTRQRRPPSSSSRTLSSRVASASIRIGWGRCELLGQHDLCEVLAKGDYDIVHYVGHSNAAGNAVRGCA
jgi:hypothetical protein